MSIQPVPPTTGPTTAGQLAARATQNDQALASWLGDHDERLDDLESRSGTFETDLADLAEMIKPSVLLDTDGVPYFILGRGGINLDVDGIPYVMIGA